MFQKKIAGDAAPTGDFTAGRPGVAPAVDLGGGKKKFGGGKKFGKGGSHGGFSKGGGIANFKGGEALVAGGFTKKIAPKTPIDADLGGAPGGLPKKFTDKKASSKSGLSKRAMRGGKR